MAGNAEPLPELNLLLPAMTRPAPHPDPFERGPAMATSDKPNRKALHDALDQVDKAAKQFKANPAKADQLRSHLATCHMVVDDLFDTVPAPTSTD